MVRKSLRGEGGVEQSHTGHCRYRPTLAAQAGFGRRAGFGTRPMGCSHGSPASDASTPTTVSVPAATSSGSAPSGGPTPGQLQGSWELVSISGKPLKNLGRLELVIREGHYGFPIGLVRGQIVARGNEVDLYNEDLCALAFSQGCRAVSLEHGG
jgi:hypothetical protein